jgi:DNA repair and recombination protein RAD54 and RAD54-like protein
MLQRAPTLPDGKTLDRLKESYRIAQPFKSPSVLRAQPARDLPERKRKRVSYKESGASDADDSDVENARSKKRKTGKDGAYIDPDGPAEVVRYPVFKPKPFGDTFGPQRRFSIPEMRGRDGAVVSTPPSHVSLGIRPQAHVPPRPLHDPMEDHAIVLYDPTVDQRETDEERRERVREEEREAAEERSVGAGLYNPHKSLRELLGGGKEGERKKKAGGKVPVVIDPRLTKVLRPHKIEGVKVRRACFLFQSAYSDLHISSCTNARQA